MANYTEEELLTLIRLYREYCQAKQGTFVLQPEDKLVLMEHLKNKFGQFDSYDTQGYVYYRRFALPHRLPLQRPKASRRVFHGEGLGKGESELLHQIESRIQSECLVDIWEGELPDVCILFATMIEAGFGAKVLPTVINNGMMEPSKVSTDAKVIQIERKKAKVEAMRKHVDFNHQ